MKMAGVKGGGEVVVLVGGCHHSLFLILTREYGCVQGSVNFSKRKFLIPPQRLWNW